MKNFYHRQIELWGEDTQNSLKDKKVAIIGCGGLGCSIGLTLGSSGVGEFYLVDFDRVELHNIHRQLGFSKSDEGRYKCEVLKDRLQSRSYDGKFKAIVGSFDDFVKEEYKVDIIIDATDNLPSRALIDSYANKQNIPWIYGSVEEFNGQVCFFEKSNFNSFKINNNPPKGITPPIVSFVASLQSTLALRYLAGLRVKKDTLYYLFIDRDGEFITKKFKMPYGE
jgi:molybdopterin/thiamine biosynthesis adenylyltransferase